jgi:hypothetical protein
MISNVRSLKTHIAVFTSLPTYQTQKKLRRQSSHISTFFSIIYRCCCHTFAYSLQMYCMFFFTKTEKKKSLTHRTQIYRHSKMHKKNLIIEKNNYIYQGSRIESENFFLPNP